MKTIIFSLIFYTLCINVNADYSVWGDGQTKGEAYIEAMSSAPSGQWAIKSIRYSIGNSRSPHKCVITWTILK